VSNKCPSKISSRTSISRKSLLIRKASTRIRTGDLLIQIRRGASPVGRRCLVFRRSAAARLGSRVANHDHSPIRSRLPLAKFAVEAHALRDLKRRDDAPLDLFARLPGSFACSPILSTGLMKVGNKSVALDGCRLKKCKQFFERFSRFLYLVDQSRAVH